MKTPTLEEVKEYFKNAKEVRCANRKKDIGTVELNKFKFTCKEDAVVQNPHDKNWIVLWSKLNGYAEIISYKDTYTVSKDFILEAHKDACPTWKTKIENKFPELFPKVELEVGKWYKTNNGHLKFFVDEDTTYGFNACGNWDDIDKGYKYSFRSDNYWILATKEEVETALIAEAKKRGFKEGVIFNNACNGTVHTKNSGTVNHKISYMVDSDSDIDGLHSNNQWIFFNGKWAEIISEPIEISLDEIAEKFGVDVSLIKIKK